MRGSTMVNVRPPEALFMGFQVALIVVQGRLLEILHEIVNSVGGTWKELFLSSINLRYSQTIGK